MDQLASPVREKKSRLRSDLRISCVEGAAFGGMVGLGETYLAAFVLAIGLGELMAGMVASLPLVAGGIMQTISPAAIQKLGSHKRWVVICALVQGLTFIPLVVAACLATSGNSPISGPAILFIAAVYWGTGLATGPAWNTWIGTIVPRPIRPRFFAIRTRASQVAVLIGFLLGGWGLHYSRGSDRLMQAYALLFATAAICRLFSAWFLTRHSEPVPIPARMKRVRLLDSFDYVRRNSGGRLLVYLIAVQASVQISGPFYTPFMFKKLELDYGQFVTLLSMSYLAKVLALPLWGRVAKRVGAKNLLWIGGIGIVPMSAGWLVSQNFNWLIGIQLCSGIAWAAYELAFFLMFFESVEEDERTSLLTIYNLFNTIAFVGGALVGGLILSFYSASYTGYVLLFGISSMFRCLSLILLARVPTSSVAVTPIGLRPLAVRPNSATLNAPILPSMSAKSSDRVSGQGETPCLDAT